MANIQKNNWDKYERYVLKKVNLTIQGLAPNKIIGRFIGPKVLLVSVPKSGTHMLESILERFPNLRNAGWKTILNESANINGNINRIHRGMFANSHLYHSKAIIELLNSNSVKTIFMIRDPRDIVVSRYKYITEIDYLHPAHKTLSQMSTNEERLTASIVGLGATMPGISDVLHRFRDWLNEENVLVVKYEDLVGSIGGGDDGVRRQTISNIVNYLEMSCSQDWICTMESSLRHKNTSTRRKGVIGGWKEEFSLEHIEMFSNQFKDIMYEYGYTL